MLDLRNSVLASVRCECKIQEFRTGYQAKNLQRRRTIGRTYNTAYQHSNGTMQTLQIHDFLPSRPIVVDPRVVLTMLGERAIRASWQVAGVARYNEAFMITGDEAADRLEALSQSQSRVSGALLSQLVHQLVQVIWGEFTAYEEGEDAPWVIVRAIDSSWCEVETDDEEVLNCVRRAFVDVRTALRG